MIFTKIKFVILFNLLQLAFNAQISQSQTQFVEIQDEQFAALSTQCGMFFFWSDSTSHFMTLLLSRSGNFGLIPIGTEEAVLIDGTTLIIPKVVKRDEFDSTTINYDAHELLLAHAKWESSLIASQNGWASIEMESIDLNKTLTRKLLVPSETRLLIFPEPYEMLERPVDRVVLGTALIGDAILVIMAPVLVGGDLTAITNHVSGILQSVTIHNSRDELEKDLHLIQKAIIDAKDCFDMMRRYKEFKN